MSCYRPIRAYYSKKTNPTGKRSLVFSPREAENSDLENQVLLPCGQCIACRLEKSRQWALRCIHEASLYEKNSFITLTYSPENLPHDGSLDYNAPVLFMKRLRDKFGAGIRSYGCAEYGEKLNRPHYHICLFNHDFDDKILFRKQNGNNLYTSNSLNDTWGLGHCTTGDLTHESAAYVARYVTKKITGEPAPDHYQSTNLYTGELTPILPERSICVSRRPGIGRDWYEKFGQYIQQHDFAIHAGKKVRSTNYYDRLFDLANPDDFIQIKKMRKTKGLLAAENLARENKNCKRDRLYIMEEVHERSSQQLKRGLENG